MLAEVKGKAVGLVGLQKSYIYEKAGINVRIVALVVQSDFRGKGVGKHLLSEAENWAKNKGAVSMSLNSDNRSEREAAHLNIVNDIARVLKPRGFLLARFNSVGDVHYGAGLGVELEPNYNEHDERRKLFFDEGDLHRLFADWGIEAVRETDLHRYGVGNWLL